MKLGTQDSVSPRHGKRQQSLFNTTSTLELVIQGAGCASCVGKIETALQQVPGVTSAEMNFAQRTVQVTGTAPWQA